MSNNFQYYFVLVGHDDIGQYLETCNPIHKGDVINFSVHNPVFQWKYLVADVVHKIDINESRPVFGAGVKELMLAKTTVFIEPFLSSTRGTEDE